MTIPELPTNSFSWSEDPRWLRLGVRELGAAFNQFVATNQFDVAQVLAPPEPALVLPEPVALEAAPASSVLTITGSLARRQLLTPLTLPSWTNTDLLTNSVVQMVVDAEGRPMSLTLLSSSGDPKADQQALEQARAARFDSIDNSQKPGRPVQGLTWGKLIFEWNTLPVPPTNASPSAAAAPK